MKAEVGVVVKYIDTYILLCICTLDPVPFYLSQHTACKIVGVQHDRNCFETLPHWMLCLSAIVEGAYDVLWVQ